jgi:hypothetical protein
VGLGKLSKDINLSIQDLSLAEIIQTAMGSPGEHLDQARNQVTDVLLMTEQATLNIMELVEQIREDCQTVQSKLLDLKASQPSEDLEEVAPLAVTDSGQQDLWDQVLFQAEEMDHLCSSGKSPELLPSTAVPVFSLADILQILLEFCTNEKVKQHLKAADVLLGFASVKRKEWSCSLPAPRRPQISEIRPPIHLFGLYPRRSTI